MGNKRVAYLRKYYRNRSRAFELGTRSPPGTKSVLYHVGAYLESAAGNVLLAYEQAVEAFFTAYNSETTELVACLEPVVFYLSRL